MLSSFAQFALLASYFTLLPHQSAASLSDGRPHANIMRPPGIPLVRLTDQDVPVVSRNGTELPPYNTTYYFNQLIDHDNPSLGTFKQRYWHTYECYEPGGPIILMTPGEINADGYFTYLTNKTINGQIAQQQNGSTIVLEHRFYGLSNPRPDLTVESLRLHTIQQAIDDLEYFSKNVKLPMPRGDQLTPDKAPWILIGGSYSGESMAFMWNFFTNLKAALGALTSWTIVNKPDLFYAGYASSGVVEAILDFWQYFEPIRLNMPNNCSSDIQAVITHVDAVLNGDNSSAIQELKDAFGLGNVTHNDDFAGSLRNNLWDWQSLQPTSGPGAQFFEFCDALEVKDGQSAPAEGWGLEHALDAWSSYFKNTYYSLLCGTADAETCIGTYNATSSFYTDTSVNNAWRSWFWIVCNEVGFLQEGAPQGHLTLVTRLVQPPYDLRQCQLMYPSAFPEPPTVQIGSTNSLYDGWNVRENRLFFANGHRDPWRDATVSATQHNVQSTSRQPIFVGDGFHCSDLSTAVGVADTTVRNVQVQALSYMKTWLAGWKPSSHNYPEPVTAEPAVIADKATTFSGETKPVNAFFKGAGTI